MARPRIGVTFWDRVNEKTTRTDRGCLEFKGCRNEHGYGRINKDGKLIYVHRAAWAEFRGPVPTGMFVCHHCDNPSCWNVQHLFIGTHAENMADRNFKGRAARMQGEAHPGAKLTLAKVAEIRKIRMTNEEIARKFGVSKSLIGAIKRGEVWDY